MENASNALLMAGSVLIGVMILSLGAYLFFSFSDYSSSMYSKIEEAQINRFNTQFLQYTGTTAKEDGSLGPVLCTAHDLITIANLAKKNNIENELDGQIDVGNNANFEYVQISLIKDTGVNPARRIDNMEIMTENEQIEFIKNNDLHDVVKKDEHGIPERNDDGTTKTEKKIKYYTCVNYSISEVTKKIYYMQFQEL